jgi:hypothetical protein
MQLRAARPIAGAGQVIAIVRGSIACPVEGLAAWFDVAVITTGPLFRSIRKGSKVGDRLTDQRVGDIVKSGNGVRRDKAALSSGCKPHPATAPAGSSRSSHGGNEVAEAFG